MQSHPPSSAAGGAAAAAAAAGFGYQVGEEEDDDSYDYHSASVLPGAVSTAPDGPPPGATPPGPALGTPHDTQPAQGDATASDAVLLSSTRVSRRASLASLAPPRILPPQTTPTSHHVASAVAGGSSAVNTTRSSLRTAQQAALRASGVAESPAAVSFAAASLAAGATEDVPSVSEYQTFSKLLLSPAPRGTSRGGAVGGNGNSAAVSPGVLSFNADFFQDEAGPTGFTSFLNIFLSNGDGSGSSNYAEAHRYLWSRIRYYIPSIGWVQKYRIGFLKYDLMAGLSVASVIIPQALSYAQALVGVDPIHGLLTSSFPLLAYSVLGTSRQLAVGPEALISILVGFAIRQYTPSEDSSPGHPASLLVGHSTAAPVNNKVATVFTLCMMVAAINFLLGFFRLGFLDNVLSRPLLRGFILAVALVVIIDMSNSLLGIGVAVEKIGLNLIPNFNADRQWSPTSALLPLTKHKTTFPVTPPNMPAPIPPMPPPPKPIDDEGESSPLQTLLYVLSHLSEVHSPTAILSLSSIVFLLCMQAIKRFCKSKVDTVAARKEKLFNRLIGEVEIARQNGVPYASSLVTMFWHSLLFKMSSLNTRIKRNVFGSLSRTKRGKRSRVSNTPRIRSAVPRSSGRSARNSATIRGSSGRGRHDRMGSGAQSFTETPPRNTMYGRGPGSTSRTRQTSPNPISGESSILSSTPPSSGTSSFASTPVDSPRRSATHHRTRTEDSVVMDVEGTADFPNGAAVSSDSPLHNGNADGDSYDDRDGYKASEENQSLENDDDGRLEGYRHGYSLEPEFEEHQSLLPPRSSKRWFGGTRTGLASEQQSMQRTDSVIAGNGLVDTFPRAEASQNDVYSGAFNGTPGGAIAGNGSYAFPGSSVRDIGELIDPIDDDDVDLDADLAYLPSKDRLDETIFRYCMIYVKYLVLMIMDNIPEILVLVVTTILLSRRFDWPSLGIQTLGSGDMKTADPPRGIDGFWFQETLARVGFGSSTGSSESNFVSVSGFGNLTKFFHWNLPIIAMKHVSNLMLPAILISVIGFVESVAVAKTYADKLNYSVSPNRELVAFGAANLVGGMFGAWPAFGSLGRSAINYSIGAKTQLAGFITGIVVIITAVFFLPFFYDLPRAVCSAIIVVAALKLIELDEVFFMVKVGAWKDIGLMLMTFLSTIVISIETGTLLSVGVSLLLVVKHTTRLRLAVLDGYEEFDPVSQSYRVTYRVVSRYNSDISILIVKIEEGLFFGNCGGLKDRLRRLELLGGLGIHPGEDPIQPAINSAQPNNVAGLHRSTSNTSFFPATPIPGLTSLGPSYNSNVLSSMGSLPSRTGRFPDMGISGVRSPLIGKPPLAASTFGPDSVKIGSHIGTLDYRNHPHAGQSGEQGTERIPRVQSAEQMTSVLARTRTSATSDDIANHVPQRGVSPNGDRKRSIGIGPMSGSRSSFSGQMSPRSRIAGEVGAQQSMDGDNDYEHSSVVAGLVRGNHRGGANGGSETASVTALGNGAARDDDAEASIPGLILIEDSSQELLPNQASGGRQDGTIPGGITDINAQERTDVLSTLGNVNTRSQYGIRGHLGINTPLHGNFNIPPSDACAPNNGAASNDAQSEFQGLQLESIIFDFSGVTEVDASAALTLLEIVEGYSSRQIQVYICKIRPDVRTMLGKAGILDILGENANYLKVKDAVQAALGRNRANVDEGIVREEE